MRQATGNAGKDTKTNALENNAKKKEEKKIKLTGILTGEAP